MSYRCSKDNKLTLDHLCRTFIHRPINLSILNTGQFPTHTQHNQAWTPSSQIRQPRTLDTIRVLWEANKLNSIKRTIRSSVRSIHSLGPCLEQVEALESSTSVIIAVLFLDPCHSKIRCTSGAALATLTFARSAQRITTPSSTHND